VSAWLEPKYSHVNARLIFNHTSLTIKIIKSSLYPKYSQSASLIIVMILITFARWRTDSSCASWSKQSQCRTAVLHCCKGDAASSDISTPPNTLPFVGPHPQTSGLIAAICVNCVYCVNCTKFGQLILRIIINIDATRCQNLRLKCIKVVCGWGSAPDPDWRAYYPPQTL